MHVIDDKVNSLAFMHFSLAFYGLFYVWAGEVGWFFFTCVAAAMIRAVHAELGHGFRKVI